MNKKLNDIYSRITANPRLGNNIHFTYESDLEHATKEIRTGKQASFASAVCVGVLLALSWADDKAVWWGVLLVGLITAPFVYAISLLVSYKIIEKEKALSSVKAMKYGYDKGARDMADEVDRLL